MAGIRSFCAKESFEDAAGFLLHREQDNEGSTLNGNPNWGQDSSRFALIGSPNSGQDSAVFALTGNENRDQDVDDIALAVEGSNLALNCIPYRELDTADFALTARPQDNAGFSTIPGLPYREQDTAGLALTHTEQDATGFSLTGKAHRSHQSADFAVPGMAHSEQETASFDLTEMANTERDIASFSLTEKAKREQHIAGFPLPGCFARSFASTEMDEIAKAIVRVNDFGNILPEEEASSQPLLLASSNREDISLFQQETDVITGACDVTDTSISACDGRENINMKGTTPRVLPSVGAFAVQCAKCLKWRLIPSKEQYEQIRQFILEKPFVCSSAALWRPGSSCNDPPELSQGMKYVWAIDKPNIPLAPNGWERLLVIRGAGASKFADIYYKAPSGKKLRSMPEIERFLAEHPEYVNAGVNLSQFSFVIPRALDENYCRKRTMGSSTIMRGSVARSHPLLNNFSVRYQPLKASSFKDKLAKPSGRLKSLARIVGSRQPIAEQLSIDYAGNTSLSVIQPVLRRANSVDTIRRTFGGNGPGLS